ncbi:MAG: AAA family ATPase [Myxococcales bacterium]|nr:AAA family ATPase [Myxococcales bacterium]
MKRSYAITVYERRTSAGLVWTPVVPVGPQPALTGKSEVRLREGLAKALAELVRTREPEDQELLETAPGTRLHHVSLDLNLRGHGRVGGRFPLVLEPRWFTDTSQRLLAYHPSDPSVWFDADDVAEVERLAPHFARHAWHDASAADLEGRKSAAKERLLTVSFDLTPRTLLDRARAAEVGRQRAGLARVVHQKLGQLGVDQTARAIDGTLPLGVPRPTYRAQLARLLGGARPRSTVVVGRPGSGRATVVARWVADRLEQDGWLLHRNSDRIHRVWRLSGKRLIAGMQYFGDWEDRLLDLVTDARAHRGLLWFDDLHLFGRLGMTRQSERSFADFFRGPVQRGELTIVATATRAQLARLEDEAPSFANLFARVAIEPTGAAETATLMLAEVRRLEAEHPIEVHPFTPRTITELATSLFPWTASPGGPIELLRKLVVSAGAAPDGGRRPLTPEAAVALAARETGLPEHLITLDAPLDPAEVTAHFAARVVGQDEAVAVATDVVVKVRAGLADPGRPLGVYLFTGPTGTGKTELATALAEYLYGDRRRLLRFDMSELAGPDAVARLIGDRFNPDGLLTTRIREQPFAVVLLDEIEKAHPAVLGLLLQLFDEGRLTDAAGEVASFHHAVVVMTSNLGARVQAPIGFGDGADLVLGQIAKAVREFFPPELWNRIDRVVRFRPLTEEVAARVVDKELAKLLGRRGLRERDVFVYAGRAVRARAVAQAFDARFGARTVKRWLEDHVAGALVDALATAPPARMTVARLREHAGAIAVELELVPEAAPWPGTFALVAARDLSAAALAPDAEAMADRIDRALAGDPVGRALAALRDHPDADRGRYFVERYADELEELRTTLVGRRPRARRAEYDEHDLEAWPRSELREREHGASGKREPRRYDPRSGDRAPRAQASQPALVAALARAELLLRHAGDLADPDAHVVTLLVTPVGVVGSGARPLGWGLLEALRAVADQAMVRGKDGRIDDYRAPAIGHVQRAFVVREVFARAAFTPEHGTHFFQSLTDEPEVYRVEVRPGAHELVPLLRAHAAALAAFEEAQAAGVAGPPNPEALLPAVRTLTYAAGARPGEAFVADVEDFVLGLATRVTAPSLAEVVRALWHVRWSHR